MKTVVWKRAQDIDPNMQMIVDGIRPQDIVQGQLNNAYFLSAVAAVAEYQLRIRRLLVQRSVNDQRAYGIALNRVGNWEMIAVDDHLPLTKFEGKEKLLGAHTQDAELWVALIEKAYAKMYHSYDNIGSGGDVAHALTDLTGAPSELFMMEQFEAGEGGNGENTNKNAGGMNMSQGNRFVNKSQDVKLMESQGIHNSGHYNQSQGGNIRGEQEGDPTYHEGIEALWELLKNADINKYIMCAATKSAEKIKEEYYQEFDQWRAKNSKETVEDFVIRQFGLYPGFCYTLLDVAEYNGAKLVRLRNSKGTIEWTGEWGDHSDKWKEVEAEYRTEIKADGIFYMPFTDFINMFEFVVINYYDDSYIHTAFKDRLQKDAMNCYELNVIAPGDYFINVSQRDLRLLKGQCKYYFN